MKSLNELCEKLEYDLDLSEVDNRIVLIESFAHKIRNNALEECAAIARQHKEDTEAVMKMVEDDETLTNVNFQMAVEAASIEGSILGLKSNSLSFSTKELK